MYDLTGKVAVVTGVGRPRGIGRATALRLAQEGAQIVLADLGQQMEAAGRDIRGVAPDLARVAAEVEEAGAEVLAVPTDVSLPRDVEALMQRAADHFGRIDIMVCNAAILADRDADPLTLSETTFARVLAVNLTGTFLCAQAAAQQMIRQGSGGKIVTLGSRAARPSESDCVCFVKIRGDWADAKSGHGVCPLWHSGQLCLSGGGGYRYGRGRS